MKNWYDSRTRGQLIYLYVASLLFSLFYGIGLIPLAILVYLHLGREREDFMPRDPRNFWYLSISKGQKIFSYFVSFCLVAFYGVGLAFLTVLLYYEVGVRSFRNYLERGRGGVYLAAEDRIKKASVVTKVLSFFAGVFVSKVFFAVLLASASLVFATYTVVYDYVGYFDMYVFSFLMDNPIVLFELLIDGFLRSLIYPLLAFIVLMMLNFGGGFKFFCRVVSFGSLITLVVHMFIYSSYFS